MDKSIQQLTKPALTAFKLHHATIAIVILAIAAGVAVFNLYQVVMISSQTGVDGYVPTAKANGSFDKKTIERIEGLKTANEGSSQLQFPTRVSPFVE